ncbi:hypothetical protein ACFL1Y_01485 [Patescibacteria group bacterium]
MNFKTLLFLFSISIILILPLNVLAIGQITEPIVIENALRGEDFQDTLVIINTEDQAIRVGLVADGEIKEWTKFYNLDDMENSIENILLTSGEKKSVNIIFSIPEDAPNGKYLGSVAVIRKPDDVSQEKGSSVSLSQRIDREATIEVGGEEKINLAVSVIPESYDIEKNKPLNIRFIYDNQGNVSLKPQIDLKIKTLEGKVAYNAIYPYPESESKVKPGSQHEIPALEIPTSGLSIGKYRVEMKFLHNGEVVVEEDFKFSVAQGGLWGMIKGASIGPWKINWLVLGVTLILIILIVVIGVLLKKKNNSTL